ncbi:MAG: Protein TonB [Bacteroidetes bacterium]|nr:Protein TonB [Bacteroidota bacterium]
MAEVSLAGAYQHSGKYGAVELKQVYQRYFTIAMGIAVAIHVLILGGYYLVEILSQEEAPTHIVRVLKYSDLGPPPSIQSANTPPPVNVSAPVVKPTVGAPVPVPDAEVSPEQTLATQTEMSQVVSPVDAGAGDGELNIEVTIDDGPPADFVPYEKGPEYVKRVEPKYPELAMRAGLEGKVSVKIWVDKEGKVKQVVVLKSDAEIFNQPSIDAAMQFVFTPAYMNNGPVAVWVATQFRFKLTDKK